MKYFFIALFAVLYVTTVFSQGIEFFHGTMVEALDKAQKEDKIVFMDCFTEWCGPCKRMAATTFKEENVGQYFNANFINVKMDMEKGEGPELSSKYNVTAYPTYLFINPKGEVVHQGLGGMPGAEFIEVAKQAMGKVDNSKEFEKAYTAGKRDPALVLKYVHALNRAGKPSLKVVNDFLIKQPDLSLPDNLRIVFEGTTQSDSKVFDQLILHKDQIVALYSEQKVKDRIEDACNKTLQNAVTFKSPELRKEAIEKMKKYVPEKADLFALNGDMKFFQASGDPKNFCKTCESFAKKQAGNDANKLHDLAQQMYQAFQIGRAHV